jgi:CheY-like chemotaxis protein
MDLINILLVEDDPDDVELLESAFIDSSIPFEFKVINQGDKVLPFLWECTEFPHIIVLDLNLPKMHGREVLTRIKSDDRFKSIPVLILTTSSTKGDMDFCNQAGADQYLVKPSNMSAYSQVIENILSLVTLVKTKE